MLLNECGGSARRNTVMLNRRAEAQAELDLHSKFPLLLFRVNQHWKVWAKVNEI